VKIKTKETKKVTYQFSLSEKELREIAAALSWVTLSDPCYELVMLADEAGVVRIGDDDIFEIKTHLGYLTGRPHSCLTKIGELSDDSK